MMEKIALGFPIRIDIDTLNSAGRSSIGIIGGADGPTSIFVASSVNWTYILAGAAALLATAGAILAAVMVVKKKRR